ncbi:hypothetical protein [Blautia hansenii]|nr:hypothetical protein [Blautia hansenii]ASM69712.1 hypothetical protein CGC63_09190 [Blautia hansenii DSM 20583]UWO09460.1 hypothetical protein NQ538_09195 [Blautia hansenii DSM 20583]
MSCKFECARCMDRRCCFECDDSKSCLYKCTKIFSEMLNVDNYKKCKDYIKNEENGKNYPTVKTETVKKDFTETIYFVKLKEKYVQELYNYNTKIANGFAGVIVNQTMSNIYFELKNTKELVIIPYEYVLWLAPVKEKN